MTSGMGPQRIDLHHHFFPSVGDDSEHLRRIAAATGWRFPPENVPWSAEKSLAFMDRHGIDVAVLSLPGSPGGDGVGPENRSYARALNTIAAETVSAHPSRFSFLANIPIPTDTDAALEELSHALDELGALGVNLTSSYGAGAEARYVADDAMDPLWEELDRRGAVVLLHGEQTPSANAMPGPLVPIPVGEVPNETYKAAAQLVATGKKRRWPNVKVVLAHGGGSLPVLAARVAVLARHQGSELTPEEMLADFRTFYVDTALVGFSTNLVAMEHFVGPEQIVFGTDFPAVSASMAEWYTANVDAFYADRPERLAQVMHGNAGALLPALADRASAPV